MQVAHLGADHVESWPARRTATGYAIAFGQFANKNVDLVLDAWAVLHARGGACFAPAPGRRARAATPGPRGQGRRAGTGELVTVSAGCPTRRFGRSSPRRASSSSRPTSKASACPRSRRCDWASLWSSRRARPPRGDARARDVVDGEGPEALAQAVDAAVRMSPQDLAAAKRCRVAIHLGKLARRPCGDCWPRPCRATTTVSRVIEAGERFGLTMRLVFAYVFALLPMSLKRLVARYVYRWDIHPSAYIGSSVLTSGMSMGPGASIGGRNVITNLDELRLGEGATIGSGNMIKGWWDHPTRGCPSATLRCTWPSMRRSRRTTTSIASTPSNWAAMPPSPVPLDRASPTRSTWCVTSTSPGRWSWATTPLRCRGACSPPAPGYRPERRGGGVRGLDEAHGGADVLPGEPGRGRAPLAEKGWPSSTGARRAWRRAGRAGRGGRGPRGSAPRQPHKPVPPENRSLSRRPSPGSGA